MSGKVWLVGAGPGDPGLITVRGHEALRRAEVVVYDRLVAPEFLEIVPEGAEVIYVGDQPGLHSVSQDEVNTLLIARAREGRAVVRLTGGDPFVLGPGDEEAAALRAAGVPFEVVNGVTSAIAAPAYAGIPITQTGLAATFAVVSGNEEREGPGAPIDWAKLATAVDTIILMDVRNLASVAAAMLQHGRAADTPVAVVGWGTHARQQTVVGNLATITELSAGLPTDRPAVAVFGEVVRLRDRLRWYDDRPLFGRRVLVTRARQHASQLRQALLDEGAEVVELPAIEILETAAPEIVDRVIGSLDEGQYGWVIFASPNTVERFFRFLGERGKDARTFGDTRVCAAGPGTAEALLRNGIRADSAPADSSAEGIVRAFGSRALGRRRILVPRADLARPDIITGLRKQGAEVEEVPLYVSSIPRQPNRESLGRLRRGEIDIVTFATVSSVVNLLDMLGGDGSCLKAPVIACLNPLTAQAAREAGLRVDVEARDQSITGMVKALRSHASIPAL